MITWNLFALINGRWVRAKVVCDTGNKRQAAAEFKAAQAALGVAVQGFDFGNAWMQWN
jgi:hypothetical protein